MRIQAVENGSKKPYIAQAAAAGLALFTLLMLAPTVEAAQRKPAAVAPPARPGFSRYVEDLPIMPGLTESRRSSVTKLAVGRRAEVRMAGAMGASVVRSFYATALAEQGWMQAAEEPYIFHRGGERLTYVVAPRMSASGVDVVFRITPEPMPPPVQP
jgi:hypothetical protein